MVRPELEPGFKLDAGLVYGPRSSLASVLMMWLDHIGPIDVGSMECWIHLIACKYGFVMLIEVLNTSNPLNIFDHLGF